MPSGAVHPSSRGAEGDEAIQGRGYGPWIASRIERRDAPLDRSQL